MLVMEAKHLDCSALLLLKPKENSALI